MLQTLHEKFSGLLAKIVLGIIVVIFGGFFGIQQYFNPRSQTFVAKVNGHEITQQDFRDRFNNLRMQMQRAYGKAFDPQTFDTPDTRRHVLDQMINEQLLLDASTKIGIAVPVADIRDEIQNIPGFQSDGKFNPDQYRMYLASENESPEEFEDKVRRDLELTELAGQLSQAALVTSADVNEYLRLRDQTRDFRFVKLDKPSFDGTISEADIAAYYKEHGSQFMTPEKVSLDYVDLDAANMTVKTSVDEATLKAQYQDQKSHYVTPGQRLTSHILISVGQNADAAAQKKALAKAEKIEAELKQGKPFAELAKEYSDDLGSKNQGGDLGWIEKGVTDPAFESALFSMKKGEISAPVKTSEGYHIIWLRDVKAEKIRTFDEVKGELEKKYLAQQRERQYSDVSGKLTDLIYQDPSGLSSAAKQLGLTVQKSGLFTRQGGTGIAANPAVVKAAFSNNVLVEGNASDPINIGPEHIVVIRVDQHDKPVPEPLETVSDQIRKILTNEHVAKLASERAEKLFAQLSKGDSLDQIADELKLKPTDEKGIGRNAVNIDGKLVAAVFGLPQPQDGKTTPGKVALADNAYALVELDSVKNADVSKYDQKTLDAARNQLTQAYASEAIHEFVDSLRKAGKVEISEERLER